MTAAPSGPQDRGLLAHLVVERPGFRLDASVHAEPGEVVVVLGPNGAGKTTALRVLAGLERPSGGRVGLDGQVLDDDGVHVPAERRRTGMVFQDHLLFPHLDATENVAFGLRARGLGRREARARALAWLERVGLAEHARALPGSLSGGQAQRVALARALVTEPRLLLLDEPLAALDAATRLETRSLLRRHLEEYDGATLLVTHDPLDALSLADRIVVLEGGRVVQEGRPAAVARAPRTDYVARLLGLNLYRGTADGRVVHLADGGTLTTTAEHVGPVFVAFRPVAVALHRTRPDGSPRNVWQGVVVGLEHHGDTVRVTLDGAPRVLADVTASAVADLALTSGSRLWAAVKAAETDVYPDVSSRGAAAR